MPHSVSWAWESIGVSHDSSPEGTPGVTNRPFTVASASVLAPERTNHVAQSLLERGPHLELRLRPGDHLVDELARAEMTAEVGRARAGGHRFDARFADRAACALTRVATVREKRSGR